MSYPERVRHAWLIGIGFGLAVLGCAGTSARGPAQPVPLSAQAAAAVTPVAVPAVARSPLAMIEATTDLDGTLVGALPGDQRATLVIVFASWCVHCRHEL